MAFEKFEPTYRRGGGPGGRPTVAFKPGRPGTLSVNKAARDALGNPERVGFLIDPDDPKAFAIVADPTGHRLHAGNCTVACISLTRALGTPAGRFAAHMEGDMLVVDLTEALP